MNKRYIANVMVSTTLCTAKSKELATERFEFGSDNRFELPTYTRGSDLYQELIENFAAKSVVVKPVLGRATVFVEVNEYETGNNLPYKRVFIEATVDDNSRLVGEIHYHR